MNILSVMTASDVDGAAWDVLGKEVVTRAVAAATETKKLRRVEVLLLSSSWGWPMVASSSIVEDKAEDTEC